MHKDNINPGVDILNMILQSGVLSPKESLEILQDLLETHTDCFDSFVFVLQSIERHLILKKTSEAMVFLDTYLHMFLKQFEFRIKNYKKDEVSLFFFFLSLKVLFNTINLNKITNSLPYQGRQLFFFSAAKSSVESIGPKNNKKRRLRYPVKSTRWVLHLF
jgi:hypothetical protein